MSTLSFYNKTIFSGVIPIMKVGIVLHTILGNASQFLHAKQPKKLKDGFKKLISVQPKPVLG